MRSPELLAAVARNRQKLAHNRLRTEAAWVLDSLSRVVPADVSVSLHETIEREIATTRCHAGGVLLTTRDLSEFEKRVQAFFNARSDMIFYIFLAHWTDAGAFEVAGGTLARVGVKLLAFDADTVYGRNYQRTEAFSLDRLVESDGSVAFELFHT